MGTTMWVVERSTFGRADTLCSVDRTATGRIPWHITFRQYPGDAAFVVTNQTGNQDISDRVRIVGAGLRAPGCISTRSMSFGSTSRRFPIRLDCIGMAAASPLRGRWPRRWMQHKSHSYGWRGSMWSPPASTNRLLTRAWIYAKLWSVAYERNDSNPHKRIQCEGLLYCN